MNNFMAFFKDPKNLREALIDYLLILPKLSLYLLLSERLLVGNRSVRSLQEIVRKDVQWNQL